MNYYIGVTETNWYEYLASINPDEVNFWSLDNREFNAINIGDLFLFKSKYPDNLIIGGGYFFKNFRLPMSLSWKAFGNKNGIESFKEFSNLIHRLRKTDYKEELDPIIGSNILVAPFFFEKEDWIPAPSDWNPNTGQGKTYNTNNLIGKKLYNKVQNTLKNYDNEDIKLEKEDRENSLYGNPSLVLPRLGQGSFKLIVTEGYNKRCAITGEKILLILDASHIKPYSEEGPNSLNNGLLLRSDLHTLFNRGFITITDSNKVLVSSRLKEEYGNGKEYYNFHGKELKSLPKHLDERPKLEYIKWHNENVYLG